jgi:hypothetical protein
MYNLPLQKKKHRTVSLLFFFSSPHYGLPVCMEAFEKVPLHMRERLASLTNGETRFIGGSIDTVYIPSRHRRDFMGILALFLETNCFLEIATPTALHLVLPPDEQALFVEHVSQGLLRLSS